MRKKILGVFLATAMVASLTVACGSKEKVTETKTDEAVVENTEETIQASDIDKSITAYIGTSYL